MNIENIKMTQKNQEITDQTIVLSPNIAVKGSNLTCSSKILESYKSIFDASLVELLKDDYNFVYGSMPEFGLGEGKYNMGQLVNDHELKAIMTDSKGEAAYQAKEAASYCLSASFGLVSAYGLVGVSSSIDTVAILAKSIDDIRQIFEKIAIKDPRDSKSTGHEILENTSIDLGHIEAKNIEDLELDLGIAVGIYEIISSGEFATSMQKYDGVTLGKRADDFETIDDIYKNSRSQGLGHEVKEKILFGNFVLLDENYEDYYDKALRARTYINEILRDALEEYKILSCPLEDKYLKAIRLSGLSYMYNPKDGRIYIANSFHDKNLIDFLEVIS